MLKEAEQKRPGKVYDSESVMGKLIEVLGKERVSDSELERVTYSGDPSALPQYHYRWKTKYLADYVVRVKTHDEIKSVLQIATEHNVPVIPRGGASSCMGSSSPSRGGISLDVKPMNQILEINKEEMFIRVEPGVTFDRIESELKKKGLSLGIYPSSALSAVIGGWISCGGRGGIGTPFYGSLRSHTLSLSVIRPDGNTVVVEGDDIDLFCHSYGILGVIVEAKLKIHENPSGFKTFSYGFDSLKQTCDAMVKIARLEKQPIFLKIADIEFQKYSNPMEQGNYVLTLTYIDSAELIPGELDSIVNDSEGFFLGQSYSEKEWHLRYDAEFNPKEECETLMFQEIWMPLEGVYELLSKYESYKQSHKVPSIWYGMLGSSNGMRIELMALLEPDQYLKFIASKGVLHKMVKEAMKIGGEPYTIGLMNSIYMSRAYPKRQQVMQAAKAEWDPNGIMNPDRVTVCRTSYRRIDVLFALATKFRWLSKFVGK